MSIQAATKLAVYYVTAPTREVAHKLSEMLLAEKLIACCNIVDNIESVYVWKEKVESEKEVLMIMKSREALCKEIVEAVIKNHPYDTPEVIGLPIVGGFGKYMDWVIENTRSPTAESTTNE